MAGDGLLELWQSDHIRAVIGGTLEQQTFTDTAEEQYQHLYRALLRYTLYFLGSNILNKSWPLIFKK